MATGLGAWSKVAADNANASSSINWAEGQTPGSVNNSSRQAMADIASWRDDTGGALTTAGGTTAFTLATNVSISALVDGARVHAVMNATNTGATTLNVDSLGAKKVLTITSNGERACVGGELPVNYHAVFQYDASADAAAGAWILLNPNPPPVRGELWGLTVSNSGGDATNDLVIAAGAAADSTNAVRMALASAITKQIDANWAVGNNAGGLDTGSASNTSYHIWLVMRPDTGVVDVLISASATSPTMPTGYTYKRRIGSLRRVGGAWQVFTQLGDEFLLKVPVRDYNGTDPGGSPVTAALGSVPVGVQLGAILDLLLSDATPAGSTFILVVSPDQTAPTASSTLYSAGIPAAGATIPFWQSARLIVRTDVSAQIAFDLTSSTADHGVAFTTVGWVDTRGLLS